MPAVMESLQVRVHKGSDAEVQGKINIHGFGRTGRLWITVVLHVFVLWLIDTRL